MLSIQSYFMAYKAADGLTSSSFPKESSSVSEWTCQFKMCFDNSLLSLLSPCCSDTVNLAPSLSFFGGFFVFFISMCVFVC